MTWFRRLWSRFVAGCATLPEWDGGWCDWWINENPEGANQRD